MEGPVRVCEVAYACHSKAAIQKVSFGVNSSGEGCSAERPITLKAESGAFWPFMWLSTLWVGISVALSTGGHPATAVLPLAAWIAHRRTEKRKFGRVNKCVRTLRTCKSEKQYADPVPNPPDSLKK